MRGHVCLVAAVCWGALLGCASAPKSLPSSDEEPGALAEESAPPEFAAEPLGWAAVSALDTPGTTGGAGGPVVTVTTTAELALQAEGAEPRVILVSGIVGEGTRVSLGSNKTVLGLPGAELHGGLRINGSVNVIVRNLKIVGNNCSDSPGCSGGADAVGIGDGAHHVWIDHCDISDGSDGNLDVNDGADYITVSWTKFWYSGRRPGGHQFSNLVGSSDNEPGDVGHLRVTYHHVWWAENVRERMPRVRYGQVHIFNSLYTSVGNSYCVGVGHFANILTEANAFYGVENPIESVSYANEQSVVVSHDNLYVESPGYQADRGSNVFVPPYAYSLDKVSGLKSLVQNGAGVCPSRFSFVVEPMPGCVIPAPAAAGMTP